MDIPGTLREHGAVATAAIAVFIAGAATVLWANDTYAPVSAVEKIEAVEETAGKNELGIERLKTDMRHVLANLEEMRGTQAKMQENQASMQEALARIEEKVHTHSSN